MKIYKNNSKVELELEEFYDLLEEDALDQVIYMVLDLDETGSINKGPQLPNLLGDEDGDSITRVYYSEGLEMEELLSMFGDNIEYIGMGTMSEEDLDEVFESSGGGFINDSTLMDNLLLSNEDLRVRKIVERFSRLLKE